MTPALSAAGAICDHVRDWLLGSRRGDWVSMGVASDGSYGVPPGLFFSFPVTCQHGCWQIVQVRACMLPCHPAHAWVLQQCFVSIDVWVEQYRVFVYAVSRAWRLTIECARKWRAASGSWKLSGS